MALPEGNDRLSKRQPSPPRPGAAALDPSLASGRLLAAILLLGLAYYGAGKLALLLAIPPGYATAVWPSAGIALGAVVVWGRGLWPGIFLASFFLNVGTAFDASSGSSIAGSLLLAMGIGLGAALQAIAGAYLVKRFVVDTQLSTERDIFRFLWLGGPMSSVVSASFGVTALVAAGRIGSHDYAFSWLTWWVGDTIGSMIFAPLVLLWGAAAWRRWPRRPLQVSLPLLLTFGLALGFFLFSSHWEQERVRLEFERRSDNLGQRMVRHLSGYLEVVETVADLFESVATIDAAEFHDFVTPILGRHPGIMALSWSAWVADADRRRFEQSLQGQGVAQYQIREQVGEKILPAARRPEYVAVTYIEPLGANHRALGFDVLSTPERRAAVSEARDTGSVVATGRVTLVQKADPGFLVFHPIYHSGRSRDSHEERRRGFRGLVTGVFRIAEMAKSSMEGARIDGIVVRLIDESAPADERLLYESSVATPAAAGFRRSVNFPMAGRHWTIDFSVPNEYLIANRSWQAWLVLVAGLLFTGLLESFLLLITGRAARVEGLVHDRTAELGGANEALRQRVAEVERAETRFRGLLESAPDAMIVVDRTGAIVLANAKTEDLFGYSRQEIIGRSIEMLMPQEFRVRHRGHRSRFVAEGRARPMGAGLDLKGQRKNGEQFSIEISLSPLETGEGVQVLSAIRDITDRKRAEEELQLARDAALESVRLKSAFLANMSHEIRTPLNVILGYTAILGESLSAHDPGQAELIDGIDRAGQRLLETIHGVLDLSKIESRTFETHAVPIALPWLIDRHAREARVLAAPKRIEVGCEILEPDARVLFDEYCLSQALLNLLGNAVKFTEAGTITVRLDRDGRGDLRLAVRDSGVGIDESYLPSLFKPFSQEEHGYTRRFEGSGLGLALTRNYLAMNGARISVESAKGKGSCFTIHFPRECEVREPSPAAELALVEPRESAPIPPTDAAGPVVLVVEDDPETQQYMSTLLGSRYRLVIAASGQEMRDRLLGSAGTVQIVLMDLSLRGSEDGLMLTRWLRAQAEWGDLPIVVTTAHAFPDDEKRALAAGATAYLAKPLRRRELIDRIERLLAAGERRRAVG